MKILSSILILSCFIPISLLFADIIDVPADTSTIQGGIFLAGKGDTVLVAEGLYYENINFDGKAITVASIFIMDEDTSHISKTIINGSQHTNPDSGSVVYFISGEDTNSVLCGFTITGGSGTNSVWEGTDFKAGGGVFIFLSGGQVIHNKIAYNTINSTDINSYGAGIASYGNSIIIRENDINNNTVNADWGGGAGADIATTETLLFEGNTVTHNIYTSLNLAAGGGILINGNDFPGRLILNRNLIKDNESHGSSNYVYGYGGGVYIEGHNPLMTNNIIVGNKSGSGGGLYIGTWSSNDRTADPVLINNTVTGNESRVGGGIYITSSNAKVINTILWDNQATVIKPEIYRSGGTFNVYYSDIAGGWEGEGNMDSDPLFSDTLFHLSEYSPCIGSGVDTIRIEENNYYCPETDYKGNQKPNPVDIYIDIGALESTFPCKAFPLSTSFLEKYVPINTETAHVNTEIFNPHNENINVSVIISSADTSAVDSTELFDDGTHEDGNAGDGLYGGSFESITEETIYTASIGINYITNDQYVVFNDNKKFTTIGPIKVVGLEIISSDTIPNHGDRIGYKLTLRNEGLTATATNVTTNLKRLDSCATISGFLDRTYGDIAPGATALQSGSHQILFSDTLTGCSNPMTTQILVEISSDGFVFWYDTLVIEVIVDDIQKDKLTLPMSFALHQNYPNPFNPKTIINYQLPMTNYVDLSIYNLVGQKVTTLVNKKQNAGYHQIEWDASNFASGIYYYQIQAGEFQDVKKMILIK